MKDLKETVTAVVDAVLENQGDEVRLIVDDETRLRAIYLAAQTSMELSDRNGSPERLANAICVEVETFNRVVIDCSKRMSSGDVAGVLQILQAEFSNQHAVAIVSLLEELRPRSSRLIAQQCERIYEHPESMGLDT